MAPLPLLTAAAAAGRVLLDAGLGDGANLLLIRYVYVGGRTVQEEDSSRRGVLFAGNSPTSKTNKPPEQAQQFLSTLEGARTAAI